MVAGVLAANPYLDEGAALFDRMLYEKAASKLKRATEVSSSTTAERRRAHDLYARALVALGQNEEAARTFVALLSTDPRAPLPAEASPTIRRMFLDAKEQLYPKGRAQLRGVPSPPPRVTAELVDPWDVVSHVELRQQTEDGPLQPVKLEAAPLIVADVTEKTTSATLVALTVKDEAVASLGPLKFDVAAAVAAPPQQVEAPATPAAPRWPLLVTGGAAVAFLATGAALSAAAASDSNTAAQQYFASDIRAYDDSARDKGIAGVVFFGLAGAAAVTTAVLFFTW